MPVVILCEIHGLCYLCPNIFWVYDFSLSHSVWCVTSLYTFLAPVDSEFKPIRLASMALVDTLPSNYWCTEHHYSQRIITNCQPQRRIYFCVPVLVPTFLIGIPHKAGVTKMFYLSFGYYCVASSLYTKIRQSSI